MPEWEVQCFKNSRLVDGAWKPLQPIEVPSESDGVGITLYQNLHGYGGTNPEILYNEATDDVLMRTRKDIDAGRYDHFYSRATGILVTVFCKNLVGEE